MDEHHAGHRLITQNLLTAAAICENDRSITWSMLEELSILIDIVCLYDQVWIVGRQAFDMLTALQSGPHKTCSSAFQVGNFNVAGVVDSASHRLAEYFHHPAGPERYRPLVNAILSPSSVARAFRPTPDGIEDRKTGELWLQTLPDNADPVAAALYADDETYRSLTFFVRTFLYLAYAEASQIPFTPDNARVPFVPNLVENERLLRRRLMKQLKASVEETAIIGDLHVIRAATPLAAHVFAAAANRHEIWQAAAELREKLWPMRARIRAAEDDLFWATQQEQARAANKWEEEFEELQRKFGRGQGFVTADGLIGFGEKAVEVGLDHSKWPKLIGDAYQVFKRLVSPRPIIELHKLARDLPGSGQTQRNIKRLFGDIRSNDWL